MGVGKGLGPLEQLSSAPEVCEVCSSGSEGASLAGTAPPCLRGADKTNCSCENARKAAAVPCSPREGECESLVLRTRWPCSSSLSEKDGKRTCLPGCVGFSLNGRQAGGLCPELRPVHTNRPGPSRCHACAHVCRAQQPDQGPSIPTGFLFCYLRNNRCSNLLSGDCAIELIRYCLNSTRKV